MKNFFDALMQAILEGYERFMIMDGELIEFPDVAEACQAYAAALGKEAVELTEAERTQAYLVAVLKGENPT